MVTMGGPYRLFLWRFQFWNLHLELKVRLGGWLGGCVCTAGIFFWEHLELWNLEHGTLGTLPRGPFFRFSKFSNLTPPGQFLTFFWPTFLKAVAFFFGWSKSLAFYLEDFAVFEVLSSCCLYVCVCMYGCEQPAFFSGSTCSFLHWNRASYGQYL